MNKENRNLNDIKYDLKIIMGNKLSIYQSKLLFMGIMYEIILNKELFPRNSQLDTFINEHLLKYLKRKSKFKGYLFKSRTILAATIQREIYNNLDYNDIINLVDEIYKILPDDMEFKNKKTIKNYNECALNEWLNVLRNKEK